MNRKQLSELTSNQYWGGLNRRFDNRVRLLHRLGIHYNQRANAWPSKRTKYNLETRAMAPAWNMTAQFIMHADHRAWNEMLADLVR